jgi:hypothetical protein
MRRPLSSLTIPRTVDTAGARALAQRIAEGKPSEQGGEPRRHETLSAAGADDGVIYIRPGARRAPGEVRTFVRGRDGRLHRVR